MASAESLDTSQDRWSYLIKSYLYDSFHAEVGLRQWTRVRPTLGIVHFQAPDWAAHRYLYFHWPDRFLSLNRRVVRTTSFRCIGRPSPRSTSSWTSGWDGSSLESDDGTAVMVLSDHGVEPVPDQPIGAHQEAPPGIIVMNGPGVQPGLLHGRPSTTSCRLCWPAWSPLADDLEGRVIGLREDSHILLPRVATYGHYSHPRPLSAGSDMQRVLTEELKALGYIH